MTGCCVSGDWKQVPALRWRCDSLEPIEGISSLHHSYDNPEAGCDYLVYRHDPFVLSDSFSVSFRIRHAFDPSSQNSWQLALLAEFWDGEGTAGEEARIVNGIVVGVNYKGSDDLVKIWKVEWGVIEEWLVSSMNYQEEAGTGHAPLFRLDWDGEGKLDLYVSIDPAEQELVLLGSCLSQGIPRGRELVLRYRYTSSRDRALWLDRLILHGHFDKDTLPPGVSAVEVLDVRTILLGFTEKVQLPDIASFRLFSEETPGGVFPDSLWESGADLAILFRETIPNRQALQLRIKGVLDFEGNLMEDTVVNLMRNEARWGDLVFNEVMADPDPAVRYDQEYLELYNRSGYEADLEGWCLLVNDRKYMLNTDMLSSEISGESAMVLQPGDFGLLRGITLPNDGAILSLYGGEDQLVHAASYRVPWDGPDWKAEGGWSLESPDVEQVCKVSSNWEYSSAPAGGTPGRVNSNRAVLSDTEPPLLLFVGLGEPGECLLHYSETVHFPGGELSGIKLDPGAVVADSVRVLEPLSEILQIKFPEDFHHWQRFRLSLPVASDCDGNLLAEGELDAGAVSKLFYTSVLINEIMYDPDEGFPEFVELYLPGEEVYDLRDFSIHFVEEGEGPDKPVALSSCSRLILPGQYLVLTKSVPHLEDAYQLEVSGCWVEVEGLSGLNNSSGAIYLTDRAGNVVDLAVYNDEMHMELLDDPGGISLERVSCDRSGTLAENWHSAASMEGYATPGRRNSQAEEEGLPGEGSPGGELQVDPEVFSPDNDGYKDLLNIFLEPGGHDWVVGLWITDLQGNQVRELANNHLAGPSLRYTWDGEGENGTIQPMGFYVIHARGYHPSTGKRWVRRKAVGLVYR